MCNHHAQPAFDLHCHDIAGFWRKLITGFLVGVLAVGAWAILAEIVRVVL